MTNPTQDHRDDGWRIPSDKAIREAQAAYDRGEVTLLEATFLADALDAPGQKRTPEDGR